MKHDVTLDASDIRAVIFDDMRRRHPELVKGKVMSVDFAGSGNQTTAKITITDQPPPSSAWD